MPIRPAAGAQLRPLLDALNSPDAVARESAVARLRVLAPAHLDGLVRAGAASPAPVRAAILRALDAVEDPRVLELARGALDDGDADLAAAAAGVLRALVASEGRLAGAALDTLLTTAVNPARPIEVRLAALAALHHFPAIAEKVRTALGDESDPRVLAQLADGAARDATTWRDAVSGALPGTPAALLSLVSQRGTAARLTELQHLVDHVRAREQRETDGMQREEWRAVRGQLHRALAARSSRLALYDLRDSLTESSYLPVAFLGAIEEIGDGSCLEPLAAAYDASSRSGDAWWREHVAAAFRAIMTREGLTRRHAVVKRVFARWPDAGESLLPRL